MLKQISQAHRGFPVLQDTVAKLHKFTETFYTKTRHKFTPLSKALIQAYNSAGANALIILITLLRCFHSSHWQSAMARQKHWHPLRSDQNFSYPLASSRNLFLRRPSRVTSSTSITVQRLIQPNTSYCGTPLSVVVNAQYLPPRSLRSSNTDFWPDQSSP